MSAQEGNPADHFVHFYAKDESLCANAARYAAEGLLSRESVVVIMTPEHTEGLRGALPVLGVDPATPLLRALDARKTLEVFLGTDGLPTWSAFEAAIAPVFLERGEASPIGRVRAYGEMVDVLWQDGKLEAAMRLETYWNRLLSGRGIPLYCAYKADFLGQESVIEHALRVHSHVRDSDKELESAVETSIDEVLGPGKARALRPLIEANRPAGARLSFAEAAVFWIKRNLGAEAGAILERSRLRLHQAAA